MSVLVWHSFGGYGCWCLRVFVSFAADRPDGILDLRLSVSFMLAFLLTLRFSPVVHRDETPFLATLLP